jgi:hypothetical protein
MLIGQASINLSANSLGAAGAVDVFIFARLSSHGFIHLEWRSLPSSASSWREVSIIMTARPDDGTDVAASVTRYLVGCLAARQPMGWVWSVSTPWRLWRGRAGGRNRGV